VFRVRLEGLHRLDAGELADRLATHESDHSPPIPIIGPLLHQVAGARQELAHLEGPPPVPIVGPALYAIRSSGKNTMVSLLDRDQLEVDRRRIEAYAREHGYYDARVREVQVVGVGPGQVDVVFVVDEGEPVRVTGIEIAGMEEAPEASASLRKPALRVGRVFTVADYDAYRDQLTAALQNNGWATAEVTQEAQVLPEEHGARVRYTVKAGPRFRFGAIFVAGAGAVSKERIRRRAAEEITQGAWFDQSKLGVAQARVFGMGVFGGTRVNRGTPDPERGVIPVVVSVREAPFRAVRLGPGVGFVSGSRVDVFGITGWTHRNFLGDLRKLDASLTVGYAWLSELRPEANGGPVRRVIRSGPVGTLAFDFLQTELDARPVDLGAHVEVQRGLEQGYDFWAQRLRLSLPVRLTKRITFIPSYNLEVYELENAPALPNPADPGNDLPSPVLLSCDRPGGSTSDGVCLLSYLEQRIEWDRRDDPLNTRRGFYLALSVQEGGRVGGYGYQYLRFVPEARMYLPIGERSVIAARARLGGFIPLGESLAPPTVALFQAGGPSSMRGYRLNRLSPYQNGVPVGGNGLVEYSVETRFPVRGNLFGAVFVDAGYVSFRSAKPTAYQTAFDPGRLQWATGVGIRYRTPVGPLRLDVAARMPNDFSSDVDFNHRFPPVPSQEGAPGSRREPIVVLHLGVGEAF
jgi:translocation and assembly module TamA